jgi:hypothetical protein
MFLEAALNLAREVLKQLHILPPNHCGAYVKGAPGRCRENPNPATDFAEVSAPILAAGAKCIDPRRWDLRGGIRKNRAYLAQIAGYPLSPVYLL